LTYIEAHLKVIKGAVSEIALDLNGTLSNLFAGEDTFQNGGEAIMTIVIEDASTTKRHLTKGCCQAGRKRRLSDSTMRGTGLSNMSDLGSHKVWD
jgi:hypothetical protein